MLMVEYLKEVASAPETEAAALLALLVSARHAAGPIDLPDHHMEMRLSAIAKTTE